MNIPKPSTSKTGVTKQRPPVIGYHRVSTKDQGAQGVGLEAQRTSIEAFAQRLGCKVLGSFDEVASAHGEHNMLQRPILREALEYAANSGAILVVHDWSRLTRSTSDIDKIALILPKTHILSVAEAKSLKSATASENLETVSQKEIANLLKDGSAAGKLSYNQKVAEEISRTTKEGMARKKLENGAVFGNPDILSLQPSGTAAASAKAVRLREDIADILSEHGGLSHGLSNNVLSDILNDREILTGQGKPFNNRSVAGPKKDAEKILRGNSCIDPKQQEIDDRAEMARSRPDLFGRF